MTLEQEEASIARYEDYLKARNWRMALNEVLNPPDVDIQWTSDSLDAVWEVVSRWNELEG